MSGALGNPFRAAEQLGDKVHDATVVFKTSKKPSQDVLLSLKYQSVIKKILNSEETVY
jgi:hypothetical protein